MSRSIKCDGCGTLGTLRELSGWQSDMQSKKLYCTNACYAKTGLPFECVPVVDLTRKIAESTGTQSELYKDPNILISISKMKPGESFKREIHANSTQAIIVLQGRIQVTIFVAEIAYPVELGAGTEKTMIVIPCGTEHQVVNLAEDAILHETYSPPPV